MTHELKILPAFFEAVLVGDKRFEVRNNSDRGFQRGDIVTLMEYGPAFTGRRIEVQITYVSNYAQKEGYVVFGFNLIKDGGQG